MFKTITNKALFAATLSIICLTICCTFTSAKFNARAETTAQTVALNEIGKESPNNKRGNAMKAVYKDKEYDLAAEHVLGGETEVVIEVVDSSGVQTRLTGTTKYTFKSTGIYRVVYTVGERKESVELKCVNVSSQPTYETDFSSPWSEARIQSANAALENGQLKLTATSENPAFFMTKGYSENFICTFTVKSASGLSVVFGRTETEEYRFKFTGSGVDYIDEKGSETSYALATNYLASAMNGEITVRLEKAGSTVKLSAKTSEEAFEKLNQVLISVDDITCVGQSGFEITEGSAYFGKFQFVNLTTLVNDNTTTVAPDPKPPVPPEPSEEKENGGCRSSLDGTAFVLIAAVLLVSTVIAGVKKESKNGKSGD